MNLLYILFMRFTGLTDMIHDRQKRFTGFPPVDSLYTVYSGRRLFTAISVLVPVYSL